MTEWAAEAGFSHGVPDRVPEPRALPSVTTVLAAFRSAGCHGTAWFTVSGADPGLMLPECPNPSLCAQQGGLDLGEFTLQGADADQGLTPDTAVGHLAFRKPAGAAVLTAMCALVPLSGPQLVFDDSGDRVFAVHPGDRPGDLTAVWPW
jgi:hypothetical protein